MSDTNFDWAALGDEWRAQPDAGIDVERLRADVRKRGRSLRRALLGEVLLTLAILAALVWLIVQTETGDPMRTILVAMIPISIGFQLWSLWLRRRQLRDDGLDVAAMLELEIGRVNASLRYWRHGTWSALLLMLAVFAFALVDAQPKQIGGLVGGAVGGGLGALFSAAMGWFKHRSGRRRLAYLRELQAQLRDG
ncbi:hypothetical protein LVB77_20285 [Lysobacter sp. 5GHs7-4]|uniref:hypothetical protein n=1 Tax=Lysobacter sp. 5GHs7-4 TaxID=2904253 RepID=UPI001E346311|nr:hypothetical protein [Lysobacter sp. 5GHs7-4]UHQ22956.1 hypothetical protein LVB77_20285 [Lysobacter sp. 5GHs7-4]